MLAAPQQPANAKHSTRGVVPGEQCSHVSHCTYIQEQQLEDEKEIGSLVWGDADMSDPQSFICLISPPFPTIVSTETFSSLCNVSIS
jgi:hypothetical protein